jgi:hypothetical protein
VSAAAAPSPRNRRRDPNRLILEDLPEAILPTVPLPLKHTVARNANPERRCDDAASKSPLVFPGEVPAREIQERGAVRLAAGLWILEAMDSGLIAVVGGKRT